MTRPLPSQPDAFAPYRVIRRLGGGLQGEAFLALDPHNKQVIIKAPLNTGIRDRRALDTEVAALRTVGSTVAPRIQDYRPTSARPHIVMEYLHGRTVDALLTDGPLTHTDTHRLAVQLATLLDTIHTCGVAHGDFRGQNIMITTGGLHAIDFGCARLRTDSYREFHHHRQADLFHLGALLVRAGTGRPPFSDDWGKAIEDYHDSKADLGALSGAVRTVARALLRHQAWRRPSAATARTTLLRG
ncbi:protein kinase [Streptomyces sp. CdTB01]|uniref:protein kinase domain-containing protein n=1 Tax=Streptomyces sp. CdTB01 TaxID=1725411 RepID=UPI00073A6B85|nr:protein kinase [Streptomyces sp. CdTB01]ALV30664.1 hypothetical protein AS200_00020 [Streptomyces sp. CdTB01]